MENIKLEDIVEAPTSEAETVETEETTEESTEQDLLKTELERVKKTSRTEPEKAAFTLKKNAERVRELGLDPKQILGIKDDVEDEDDAPVTVGMLKKIQQESTVKTALQLAEEIQIPVERELVKYHIENTIKSTGNPSEDLRLARAIVNSAKNSQIIEEAQRKVGAKTHSSSSGAPSNSEEKEPELTQDELAFMRPPFNLTKEQVIKSRKK